MAYARIERPCKTRYEVRDGNVTKHRRDSAGDYVYGPPRIQPVAYVWPEARDRYIVAIAIETRRWKTTGRNVGCYHTFPTKDAAIMYALSVGGG